MPIASTMVSVARRRFAQPSFAAVAVVLGVALLCGDADADLNTKERLQALAKLPDWSGIWESSVSGNAGNVTKPAAPVSGGPGAAQRPAALPYNATWQAKFDAQQKKLGTVKGEEQTLDNAVTDCVWGIPRIFDGPYTFEITVLPEQTFINYDVSEYRHIWTDGRVHPLRVTPTDMGHSIGHWEGETLIVNTLGLKPALWVNNAGATLSEKAVIAERWSQTDRDHLKVEVTVEDPLALSKPYTSVHRYQRIMDTNRQLQQNCFENRREAQEASKPMTKPLP